MPNQQFLSLSGALLEATEAQAALAASELRLFQSDLVPVPGTVLADFESNEADYTGYTAGGITLTTWNDPILDPAGGYSIGSPVAQFTTDDPTTVTNLIGGWYLVTSGGDLYGYGTFSSPLPMQEPGQGIPINCRWVFPDG